MGDPTLRDNWMGPVINRRAYESYRSHVAELRARGPHLPVADTLDAKGFYVTPTVVDELPADHYPLAAGTVPAHRGRHRL